ncbi:hypothetical protein [Rhodanobacter sp. C05]|uniref:hypothetical protein n=1 Tax=Rhodanobacter sp. C05 TaxID=1945855 RepID=UPI00098465A3|nr:hypothetical protein [Rhodanobacter sp. C05]OOG41596.1 hypothetical protein B0E51_07955 [Rhodanobacter sp. C05]
MSKDKSHKKDKLKNNDLFSLMLEQSEIFRNMVAHFQSAWTPKAFSNKHDESANIPQASEKAISKKRIRTDKSVRKAVAKAVPVAKNPATAARKTGVKKAPGATKSKPVVAKKSAVKAARHSTKKAR